MVSELTLWESVYFLNGLNPCFSGGWSRSCGTVEEDNDSAKVLILVLVEDGLGGSLNPIYIT